MATVGMDTDLATSQHTQLSSQGVDALQTLIGTIDGLVSQIASNWRGNDATNFESEWSSTHKTQLSNVHQALADFTTKFNTNIQDQIRTSAT